jgi:hypothetical protein
MLKIIKSGGHCYDGCGWNNCSFWEFTPNAPESHKCTLFGGGVRKLASESLVACNKIYGESYEGNP